MRKFSFFVLAVLVLSFEFCYAASITKESESDFSRGGASFESTTATIEPGSVILEISGEARLWTGDGAAISTADDHQSNPSFASDGSGGAIIAWGSRVGANYDIYAQRVDNSGAVQWMTNGVTVCAAVNMQRLQELVPDGSGGAIIVWEDRRTGSSDIYAQRVDSNGVPQWTTDGVTICAATGTQSQPRLVPDGSGGAIIAWEDQNLTEVYVQRVGHDGNVLWAANGIRVCATTSNQEAQQLVPDGSGGAILCWRDDRGANSDVYAQRMDGDGIRLWAADGEVIANSSDLERDPLMMPDDSGGAMIAFERQVSPGNYDIYAQRINSSGVVQWTANGEPVCTAAQTQQAPYLVSDGSGGAIIAWYDYRDTVDYHIYAQRLNGSGAAQWTTDGVAVCTAAGGQTNQRLVADESGGAIIVWQDFRSGSSEDVYAQRIDSNGNLKLATNGIPVCATTVGQEEPEMISDGNGGAIITWQDLRAGGFWDVYAQRINEVYFVSGRYTTEKIENTDVDFSGWTTLSWVGAGIATAEVKAATSESALDNTSWTVVSNNSTIPNAFDLSYKWIQFRSYFSPSDLNTATSRLQSLSLDYATDPRLSGGQVFLTTVSGPNPFSPLSGSTYITYQLSQEMEISVYIFSASGEMVFRQNIVPPDEGAHIGYNRVEWNGRKANGEISPNGVYLYKIMSGGKLMSSGKIILLQ